MRKSKLIAILLALVLVFSVGAECFAESETADAVTVTDNIGREVTIIPGSYQRVVCIGAGALRMYCYIADVSLLCGVKI